MGVWGWVVVLMVLWEKWVGPYGRIGPMAYLIEGEQGEVYLGEGRRLWRLQGNNWESVALLPGEGRAGAVDPIGRLWVLGLNALYIREGSQLRTLSLPQAGWGEAIWVLRQGIAVRAATQSFWIAEIKNPKPIPLPGPLIGVSQEGLWIQRADSVLKGYPGQWQLEFLCPTALQRFVWNDTEGWGLSQRGEVYRFSAEGIFQVRKGVRLMTPHYFVGRSEIFAFGAQKTLWSGAEEIYAVCEGLGGAVVWMITSAGVVALYPKVKGEWRHLFPAVFSSWKKEGGRWVVWQGERAYFPEREEMRRYPATLIEGAYIPGNKGGYWVWATPRGLLNEAGQAIAERGYYVKSVATQNGHLAWAVGREITLQSPTGERRKYTFPMAVQGVAWTPDKLWVWGGTYVYHYTHGRWQGETVDGYIEEGRVWEDRLCLRVGALWLQRRQKGWDTLAQAPWLCGVPPLSPSWGTLLATWVAGKKRYLLLSHGLIEIEKDQLNLPPLQLKITLRNPSLKSIGGNKYEVPAERAALSLSWDIGAPFLPGYAVVHYQVGQQPPLLAEGREVLLNLPPEGEVPVRLFLSHPWYPIPRRYEWVIRVVPPWYRTTYARIAGLVLLLLLIVGGVAVREWYHRQLQRRLAEERSALAQQVQRQQTQLLQSERMANLGVMAAHIAHEINTPLGIIQSALSQIAQRLATLRPALPRPERPPQSPADRRMLFEAWQNNLPDAPLFLLQQLAILGYVPEQWPALALFLDKPETLPNWLAWIELETYLSQAQAAAEKLQERVQRIRMYVRDIREGTEKTRVNLQESILRTIDFYKPLLRRVQVETEWPTEPVWVEGDAARLDQVWANLIQNALQAMPPDKGRLRIAVQQAEAHQALVLIQDNGHGIPPEIRDRIFDPLFTTKAPGEGTGLGLPICQQILHQHGGTLKLLHSEPGYTLFGVWLPLAPPENP